MKTENVANIGIKSTKDETIFITSKFIQIKSFKKNKQHSDHCIFGSVKEPKESLCLSGCLSSTRCSKALNLHLSLIGLSQVSLRSLCAYFVRQTEPKILCLVVWLLILTWVALIRENFFFKFAYMGKFRWPYRSVPILPYLDQTSSIGWTQPQPQPQPQPSHAALVEAEVEVKA